MDRGILGITHMTYIREKGDDIKYSFLGKEVWMLWLREKGKNLNLKFKLWEREREDLKMVRLDELAWLGEKKCQWNMFYLERKDNVWNSNVG